MNLKTYPYRASRAESYTDPETSSKIIISIDTEWTKDSGIGISIMPTQSLDFDFEEVMMVSSRSTILQCLQAVKGSAEGLHFSIYIHLDDNWTTIPRAKETVIKLIDNLIPSALGSALLPTTIVLD